MEVILKEDVNKLGHRGDVVKVAEGYGRNFLLPKKLAMEATPGNKSGDRADEAGFCSPTRQRRSLRRSYWSTNSTRSSWSSGTREWARTIIYFGSVTAGEIAQQLEHPGFTIDRRKLQLEEPLRQLGEFHVRVKFHREVTAHVKVTVKAEDAEA